MNIIEMAKEAHHRVVTEDYPSHTGQLDPWTMNLLERIAELVRADERHFIATKWETLYGYDKQGVAEFIRKRANTQGEQHEHH